MILIFICQHNHCLMLILFYPDKKEGYNIKTSISNLPFKVYHSTSYYSIPISYKHHHMNLVISKYVSHKEPFLLLTNGKFKTSVKDYRKKFDSIECIFKTQKSNGFRIESINRYSLKSFTTMYTLVCFCITFLTILGTDYKTKKYNFRCTSFACNK